MKMTTERLEDILETCETGWELSEQEAADLRAHIATLTAENVALRASLTVLVREVADYEAWQRPCLALDNAHYCLSQVAAGDPK